MDKGPNKGTHKLAGVSLFEGLDFKALADVAAAAGSIEKERSEVFFRQGQAAHSLFVITQGRVKVTQITPEGHQIVVRYAGKSEMFGCVPVYGGKEYPATATAVTACKALAWNRSVFDQLMKRHPRIAVNALEILGEELAHLRLRYQELVTKEVEQRVARALVRLVHQAGRKVEGGVLIAFPLSRQDLAELTGTTLHTVSRILRSWEKAGVVASGRQRISVRQPHALVAIAENLDEPGESKMSPETP